MNSSLFDYFEKQLHFYYKFLSQYRVSFKHVGLNKDALVYSVSIHDPSIDLPTQKDVNTMLEVLDKISSFGKLFDIHIINKHVCLSDGSIYEYEFDFD